jgi:FkbM family methyltransferase
MSRPQRYFKQLAIVVTSAVKRFTKNTIRRLGWDVHRFSLLEYPAHQVLQSLERVGADLIFDIGANSGQFAKDMRAVGYKGEIISFEPLHNAHRELSIAAFGETKWRVHPRCAIGDFDGEIEINVAANSVSSSVLPMLDSHSAAAVDSSYIGSERVPISKLDTIASTYLKPGSRHRYILKIDTQGFEWQVLDGASQTLKTAQGVICELSLVPLYKGQRLWREIVDRLEGEGFALWAVQRGFTDLRDGRSLQIDAVFLRADSI